MYVYKLCTYVDQQWKPLYPLCSWSGYLRAWQTVRSRSPSFLAVSVTQPTKPLIVWVRERCCLSPLLPALLTLVSHNNPSEIFIMHFISRRPCHKMKSIIRFDRYVFNRAFLKSSAVLVLKLVKDHSFFIFQRLDARKSRPLRERI